MNNAVREIAALPIFPATRHVAALFDQTTQQYEGIVK